MIKRTHPITDFFKREPLYGWLLVFILLLFYVAQVRSPQGWPIITEPQKSSISDSEKLAKEVRVIDEKVIKQFWRENKPLLFALGFTTIGGAAGLFLGMIFLVIFITSWLQGRELARSIKLKTPQWGTDDVAKVAILIVFLSQIFHILQSAVVHAVLRIKEPDQHLHMLVRTTFLHISALGLIIYFAMVRYKQKLLSLGLTIKNLFKNLFIGIAGYITTFPVLLLTLMIVMWVAKVTGYKPPPQPILEFFLKEKRIFFLIYFTLFMTVIGPIVEELYFRGFAYPAIKKWVGTNKAIFLTGFIFSALHMNITGFLPVMILGLILTYLYEKTGSLIPSIGLHVVHNLSIVLVICVTKGFAGTA